MAVRVIVKVVISCHDSYGGSGCDDDYYGCDSDSK
jgi:hypothetical protein